MVSHLLARGASIHQCNKKGFYPLHIVVDEDLTEITDILLNAGAAINQQEDNEWGDTPLTIAVCANKTSMVSHLLARGASVHQCNKKGFYPLHIAAENGFIEITNILLSAGAAVNQQADNVWGDTPLVTAISNNNANMVSHLIARGASVQLCNKQGCYPIHFAAENGDINIMNILLNEGNAFVDQRLNIKRRPDTALTIAIRNKHQQIMQRLVDAGANPKLCKEIEIPQEFFDFLIHHHPDAYLDLMKIEKRELDTKIKNKMPIPKTATLIGETISGIKQLKIFAQSKIRFFAFDVNFSKKILTCYNQDREKFLEIHFTTLEQLKSASFEADDLIEKIKLIAIYLCASSNKYQMLRHTM